MIMDGIVHVSHKVMFIVIMSTDMDMTNSGQEENWLLGRVKVERLVLVSTRKERMLRINIIDLIVLMLRLCKDSKVLKLGQ